MSTETIPINTETFLRRQPTDQMSPDFLLRFMHVYVSLVAAKQDRKRLLELNPVPQGLVTTYDQLIASLEKFYASSDYGR